MSCSVVLVDFKAPICFGEAIEVVSDRLPSRKFSRSQFQRVMRLMDRGPSPTPISVIPSGYSGVVSRPKSYLVFDIETIPDGSLWSPPPATGSSRPGTIDDFGNDSEISDASHSNGKDRAFPPAYAHTAIVMAWLWLDESYRIQETRVISTDEMRSGNGRAESLGERGLLHEFSRFVEDNRPALVTYNGRAFDIPVIALRSLRHGVAMPWYYQDNGRRYRYSVDDHIDLCDWLADRGATRSGSLDALAKLIGLPGKLGMDGSRVEDMYRKGHIDHIQRYCLADVAQTALLFVRFRLLQGLLDRDEYRAIVADLTEVLSADPRLLEFVQAIDDKRLLAA